MIHIYALGIGIFTTNDKYQMSNNKSYAGIIIQSNI